MKMVLINKRTWAVGLMWAPRSGAHERGSKGLIELRKKLAEDPSNEGFDLIVLRAAQYGLGASGGDRAPWQRARALAAALKTSSASFLGLFQLRDVNGESFWWVCAIRSGLISAQSDMLFDSRESAESHIRVSIKGLLGEFEEEIVCEDVDKSLAWLSPLLRSGLFPSRQGKLSPLRVPERKTRLVAGIVAAVTLAAAGYGLFLFLEHKAGLRAMEAARLALQDKETRRRELLEHPEKVFATPWMTAPDPAEVWSACAPAMLSLPLSANGWELASASCDGKSLSVTWNHKPGADYLLLPPRAKLSKSAQQAVSSFPLQVPGPGHGVPHQMLPGRDEVSRYIYQLTQSISAHLKLSFASRGHSKTVEKITITAPWLSGSWELSGVPAALLLDSSLAEALRLPGLMLTAIEYAPPSWTFRGQSYVIEKK